MPPERQKPYIPDVKEKPRKGNPLSLLKRTFAKPEKLIPTYETETSTNPDISNNNNDSDIKPNIFAIAKTPARLPKIPSKERSQTVSDPTEEEVKAANAGEYAPRGFTRIMLKAARNHPLRTGLAVTAGLTAATYAIPAVHEQVNSDVADLWKSTQKAVESKYNSLTNKQSPVFQEVPAGRTPDKAISPANLIDLPSINPYQDSYFNKLNNAPGIIFHLNENPPQQEEISIITPNGIEKKTITKNFPAWISINGYVIAKELNDADGSVRLAIEIPNDQPFTQDDIDKSFTSVEHSAYPQYPEDEKNNGKIKGVIVWLDIKSNSPFGFWGRWWKTGFNDNSLNEGMIATDPKEIFRYIRIGDPVTATASPKVDSRVDEELKQNSPKYGYTYNEAKQRFTEIANENATAIQSIEEGVNAGGISLKEQLQSKKYSFVPNNMSFVPRN